MVLAVFSPQWKSPNSTVCTSFSMTGWTFPLYWAAEVAITAVYKAEPRPRVLSLLFYLQKNHQCGIKALACRNYVTRYHSEHTTAAFTEQTYAQWFSGDDRCTEDPWRYEVWKCSKIYKTNSSFSKLSYTTAIYQLLLVRRLWGHVPVSKND